MAPIAISTANGHTNGQGHGNGHSHAHANGHTNANSHTNANGHTNTDGPTKSQSKGHLTSGIPVATFKPPATTVAGVINAVASVSLESKRPPLPPRRAGSDSSVNGTGFGARSTGSAPSVSGESSGSELRSTFRDVANSVWVITGAHEGVPAGFTAISINCVSIDPPMITFNLGRNSSSLNTLTRSLRFAAHLLDHDAGDTAKRFAQSTDQRFVDTSKWAWHADGLPELHGVSLARLSGSIVSFSAAGDNLLALCRVDTTVRREGRPLVHHQGGYHTLAPLGAAGTAGAVASPRPRDRRIYLNAFDMCCIGHQSPGLWTHPFDKADTYKDLEYWTNLAQLLEKGGFDCLFLADVLGTYDVYKGTRDTAIATATQVPVNDPTIPISAMAAVTKKLGFGITVSLTYELPYAFARRMSTLDHLTKGRVAWNVVTGYLKSAALNLGLTEQVEHDERYNIAEEFIEVTYKLWEGSWEQDAVVKDRRKGIYADPAKVHDINHEGKYFKVPGAHLCEPSPQRTPFIFQAGASPKGQSFGGRHAEAVFISGPTPAYLKKTVASVRKSAVDAGRDPYAIKVFTLVTIITGATDEEAQAKYDDLKQFVSIDGALTLYGGWAGVDLSQVPLDQPLQYVENDSIRSVNRMWSKQSGIEDEWTARKVGEKIAIGGLGPLLVGSGKTVAKTLEEWVDITDVDGFNLAYATSPGTFEDIIEHVVPELRKSGRLPPVDQEDARPLTLRERLGGNAHVAPTHPAYKYKISK